MNLKINGIHCFSCVSFGPSSSWLCCSKDKIIVPLEWCAFWFCTYITACSSCLLPIEKTPYPRCQPNKSCEGKRWLRWWALLPLIFWTKSEIESLGGIEATKWIWFSIPPTAWIMLPSVSALPMNYKQDLCKELLKSLIYRTAKTPSRSVSQRRTPKIRRVCVSPNKVGFRVQG